MDALPGQNAAAPLLVSDGTTKGVAASRAKAYCEAKSFGGLVLGVQVAYFRQASVEELRSAAVPQEGCWLCLRERDAVGASSPQNSKLRVVVIATQDEFDETMYQDPDLSVSAAGNGRKYAVHAMLRTLAAQPDLIQIEALLIVDVRADTSSGPEQALVPVRPLPVEGPARIEVKLRNGPTLLAWLGDSRQMLFGVAGELTADLGIATVPSRPVLGLLHSAVVAPRFIVFGHDYNMPYGPWGARESTPELKAAHCALMEKTVLLCTSRHLAEYMARWSGGRIDTRLCYCADYGYFDDHCHALHAQPSSPKEKVRVALISPCPAKGLSLFRRVARELPEVPFLAVSTCWTKTVHEAQLRAHPNVEILTGGPNVALVYERTAVLLMPSIWSEAFGLVAVEAQLRGIPVVSTDAYGLREANFVPELRVPDVKLVQDMKMRALVRGHTLEELEHTLPLDRTDKLLSEEQKNQATAFAHLYLATAEEAQGFTSRVAKLWHEDAYREKLGEEARRQARDHVLSRRGLFVKQLLTLASEPVQHPS